MNTAIYLSGRPRLITNIILALFYRSADHPVHDSIHRTIPPSHRNLLLRTFLLKTKPPRRETHIDTIGFLGVLGLTM